MQRIVQRIVTNHTNVNAMQRIVNAMQRIVNMRIRRTIASSRAVQRMGGGESAPSVVVGTIVEGSQRQRSHLPSERGNRTVS